MRLQIRVTPERQSPASSLPPAYNHIVLNAPKPVMFNLPARGEHTFAEVWTLIEERYKTNYPAQAMTFVIKKLQDDEGYDLDMSDTVDSIFGDQPKKVVHVIQAALDREMSIVNSSNLRPLSAPKRPADAVFAVPALPLKRRRVEENASSQSMDSFNPDMPIVSSENPVEFPAEVDALQASPRDNRHKILRGTQATGPARTIADSEDEFEARDQDPGGIPSTFDEEALYDRAQAVRSARSSSLGDDSTTYQEQVQHGDSPQQPEMASESTRHSNEDPKQSSFGAGGAKATPTALARFKIPQKPEDPSVYDAIESGARSSSSPRNDKKGALKRPQKFRDRQKSSEKDGSPVPPKTPSMTGLDKDKSDLGSGVLSHKKRVMDTQEVSASGSPAPSKRPSTANSRAQSVSRTTQRGPGSFVRRNPRWTTESDRLLLAEVQEGRTFQEIATKHFGWTNKKGLETAYEELKKLGAQQSSPTKAAENSSTAQQAQSKGKQKASADEPLTSKQDSSEKATSQLPSIPRAETSARGAARKVAKSKTPDRQRIDASLERQLKANEARKTENKILDYYDKKAKQSAKNSQAIPQVRDSQEDALHSSRVSASEEANAVSEESNAASTSMRRSSSAAPSNAVSTTDSLGSTGPEATNSSEARRSVSFNMATGISRKQALGLQSTNSRTSNSPGILKAPKPSTITGSVANDKSSGAKHRGMIGMTPTSTRKVTPVYPPGYSAAEFEKRLAATKTTPVPAPRSTALQGTKGAEKSTPAPESIKGKGSTVSENQPNSAALKVAGNSAASDPDSVVVRPLQPGDISTQTTQSKSPATTSQDSTVRSRDNDSPPAHDDDAPASSSSSSSSSEDSSDDDSTNGELEEPQQSEVSASRASSGSKSSSGSSTDQRTPRPAKQPVVRSTKQTPVLAKDASRNMNAAPTRTPVRYGGGEFPSLSQLREAPPDYGVGKTATQPRSSLDGSAELGSAGKHEPNHADAQDDPSSSSDEESSSDSGEEPDRSQSAGKATDGTPGKIFGSGKDTFSQGPGSSQTGFWSNFRSKWGASAGRFHATGS